MKKTRAEKLTILAARIIEYEEELVKSATVQEYTEAIRSINLCLDLILQTEELVDFQLVAQELKIELKRLEVGEIMKRQFSCDKLYKKLIITAANEINK